MPLAVGLEALISAVVLGAKPPVSHKPAPSAREARELVEFMTEALDRLGRREEVTRDELPNELGVRMPPAATGTRFSRLFGRRAAGGMDRGAVGAGREPKLAARDRDAGIAR